MEMQKEEKGRADGKDLIKFEDSNMWRNFKTAEGKETYCKLLQNIWNEGSIFIFAADDESWLLYFLILTSIALTFIG